MGEASYRVLYTIGEEDVVDRERQDLLLGLAKTVANSTAALVLKAKNVASECEDQYTQNRVSHGVQKIWQSSRKWFSVKANKKGILLKSFPPFYL